MGTEKGKGKADLSMEGGEEDNVDKSGNRLL